MPFQLERLADAPIIVVSFSGEVDAQTVSQSQAEITRLIEANPTHTALIFDTTHSAANFKDILSILQSNVAYENQTEYANIIVLPAFVGSSAMVKLYVEGARQKQFGGRILPLFASVEDAITTMRVALANLSEKKPSD